LLVATVLSLGVVPPFYVVIKQLEERWFGEGGGAGGGGDSRSVVVPTISGPD
jgi:hydrophobic/amphiphilic exporter-1 (mainly G- bacteria), HAE1 family